jgi:hypothetical protein
MGVTAVGINKQLDLQSLMIDLGRHAALAEELMIYRRVIQEGFVVAASGAATAYGRGAMETLEAGIFF